MLPQRISGQLTALMVFAVIIFNVMMTSTLGLLPRVLPPSQETSNEPYALQQAGADPRHLPVVGSEIGLLNGRGIAGQEPRGHLPPPLFGVAPLFATFLFLAITVSTLGLWAARALIRPLKAFERAAEQFRAGKGIVQLEETGPAEIRSLARALNEMQSRISDLVAERTRMLAAIGHDLRTPITRLRLRAEFMPHLNEQRRMLADLDHMEAMVRDALAHLQDIRSDDTSVPTDLVSLLQTITDQFGDLGTEVSFDVPRHVIVRVMPHDLQRAVTNLVENAVRYGSDPEIRITRVNSGDLEVRIEDRGPGISDAQKDTMMKPFARGETARTMNEFEGFGLGLSIARQVCEAHGGKLELRDRQPQGLTAAITLPAALIVRFDEA